MGAQRARGGDGGGDRHRPRREGPGGATLPVLISPSGGRLALWSNGGFWAVPGDDRTDEAIAGGAGDRLAAGEDGGGCARGGEDPQAAPRTPARAAAEPCSRASRRSATGHSTSLFPASVPGARRSRSSTASAAAQYRWRRSAPGACCRWTSPRRARATRLRSGEFVERPAPAAAARRARDGHARLPLRRAVAVDTRRRYARAASGRCTEIFGLADLRHWLPSERLVAGSDSGNFVSTSASSRRLCATSGRCRSSPTASRSQAACSTRW